MNVDQSVHDNLLAFYNSRDISLSGPVVEVDPFEARIAHLAPEVQEVARGMSFIHHLYPVRGAVTADRLRATIVCPAGFKQKHPEVYGRYSRLFFGPHHAAVCEEFHAEFSAVAADYGIQS